jgi:Txe/YoeB family toxin of toxin-antitoxin system
MYNIFFTKQAIKDSKKIDNAGLKPKVAHLLRIIRTNPFQTPPKYEKLKGLSATYSRRIDIENRLVYEICENNT